MSPLIVILLLFYALLVATALLVWLALTLPKKRRSEHAPAQAPTPARQREAPKKEAPRVTVAPRPAEPATDPTNPRPTNDTTRGAWVKKEAPDESHIKEKNKDERGRQEDDPFERFVRSRRDDLDL